MVNQKFLLISAYALSPPLLRVAEIITLEHSLAGHVIAPDEAAVSTIYHPTGKLTARDVDRTSSPLHFHFVPAAGGNAVRRGFDRRVLTSLLLRLNPDYIWVHDEFTHSITLQILRHYRFNRRPRLIAFVAQNHIPGPHPLFSRTFPFISRTRLKQIFLWPRLDGVMACAHKSLECARRMKLPGSVPLVVAYHPTFGAPEGATQGATLPWSRNDGHFLVGFAGALSEQKGWKILLQAMAALPEKFKVVLVGAGEQRDELQEWLKREGLTGRASYIGPLPHQKLLATYPQFDAVVLPSVTLPHSVEQFGRVLAEAMSWGVPVIGSDSGAIPEIVGPAGLIVPEGNSPALAAAIQRINADVNLGRTMGAWGRQRFLDLFSCSAYAQAIAKLFEIDS